MNDLALEAGLHAEWFIDHPEIEDFGNLLMKECLLAISSLLKTGEDFDENWNKVLFAAHQKVSEIYDDDHQEDDGN